LKGNFERTGAIKAIAINPSEHPAQERGNEAWENQQQITTLRYDLKMSGEKCKFSQRGFYSQRQSGTSVTGDGLSNTYRTSVLGVAQYRV
jgi:hypothetical protein